MSFGPPPGSPFSGPSATQTSAAAGLPFAGMPTELVPKAKPILESEPDHSEPDIEFSQSDYDRRPFTLRRFLAPHRLGLLGAVALVVVETLALQAGPLLTQIGLDRAVIPRNASMLVVVALAFLASVVVNTVASRVRISYTGRLGERLMYKLRVQVFSHFQRQSLDFFTGQKAGVLLTRMTSDIDALAALFQDGLVNLAVQLLTLIIITVVLTLLNPTLALITLAVIVPAMAVLTLWFRSASERGYTRVRERIADVLGDLSESLAGMRVITASTMGHRFRPPGLVDAELQAFLSQGGKIEYDMAVVEVHDIDATVDPEQVQLRDVEHIVQHGWHSAGVGGLRGLDDLR